MHLKQFALRDVERQAGDGRTFAATMYDASAPDRDRESIDVATARARGPIPLQVDHDRSVLKTVGRVSNVHAEGSRLRGTLTFAPEGVSEVADQVFRQVDAGVTTTVSIGFLAAEPPQSQGGIPVWRDIEVIELSFVSVPSSPGARVDGKALKAWLGNACDEIVVDIIDSDDEIDDDVLRTALRELAAEAKLNPAKLCGLLGEAREPRYDVDPHELGRLIAEVVVEARAKVIADATQAALNKLRGRLD